MRYFFLTCNSELGYIWARGAWGRFEAFVGGRGEVGVLGFYRWGGEGRW